MIVALSIFVHESLLIHTEKPREQRRLLPWLVSLPHFSVLEILPPSALFSWVLAEGTDLGLAILVSLGLYHIGLLARSL
jgi:hypothetical protein